MLNKPTAYTLSKKWTMKQFEVILDEPILDLNQTYFDYKYENIPLIVFFGAKRSGKKMTLIRLSRYLIENGYGVEFISNWIQLKDNEYDVDTDESFYSNIYFTKYKAFCDEFERNIYKDVASDLPYYLNYFGLLVKVSKNGKDICQILKVPGIHCFDAEKDLDFPTHIQEIINNSLPKTWVIFVEKNWENELIRARYYNKVFNLFNLMNPKDKVILLCNKVDKHPIHFDRGKPKVNYFLKEIKEQYPAIFVKKRKQQGFFSLLSSLFTQSYEFVVFSAGTFTKREGVGQTYIPSNEFYPDKLWKKILKSIK